MGQLEDDLGKERVASIMADIERDKKRIAFGYWKIRFLYAALVAYSVFVVWLIF